MGAHKALSSHSRELLIKSGETIYQQNTISDGAYIIIEGRIEKCGSERKRSTI